MYYIRGLSASQRLRFPESMYYVHGLYTLKLPAIQKSILEWPGLAPGHTIYYD